MTMTAGYQGFMPNALTAAKIAADAGDVPVGAVVISPEGAVLAVAGNRVQRDHDPTAHAEILAIREATRTQGNQRPDGCHFTLPLEP